MSGLTKCTWFELCTLLGGVNDALFSAAPNIQQSMTQNITVTLNEISNMFDFFYFGCHKWKVVQWSNFTWSGNRYN